MSFTQRIGEWLKKTKKVTARHKILATVFVLALLLGGWWTVRAFSGSDGETRYVLSNVSKGTIVVSVSASGQVSASKEIEIKPKASGDITWVGIAAGDTVRAGQAIASIDSTDAKSAVADAEHSLAQAKLQYQKDEAQAPIDYEKDAEELEEAKVELETTYSDTFNTLSNAYLDLPTVMSGLQDVLFGYDLSTSGNQWNIDTYDNLFNDTGVKATVVAFSDKAQSDYVTAREAYDKSLLAYKELTRYSSGGELEEKLSESIDTVTAIAQALQSQVNLIDTVIDYATRRSVTLDPDTTTLRSDTEGYLGTTNSNLSALLSQQKSLDATKKAIRDNERSLQILEIGNPTGADPISLQSSRYSITNQEQELQNLKDELANYTVVAPFGGTMASVAIERLDSVNTSSSVATIITDQKIAELSLNEVDAAKIALGDRATLTFDAIEDLTLTGHVSEIDALGAVSQGVVSYTVKIVFDTQDERVKSGMTVNAAVITDTRQDVLVAPASAVKTANGILYVQVFDPPLAGGEDTTGVVSAITPQNVPVEVGISDDINMEIISGLSEGQQIVVRTSTSNASQATTQNAPSLFGGGTVRTGAAGGNTQVITR